MSSGTSYIIPTAGIELIHFGQVVILITYAEDLKTISTTELRTNAKSNKHNVKSMLSKIIKVSI